MQKRSPVAKHRSRQARAGFVRVEISIRKEDVPLVRQMAAALTDPAPLDGIDLERARDFGRDLDGRLKSHSAAACLE